MYFFGTFRNVEYCWKSLVYNSGAEILLLVRDVSWSNKDNKHYNSQTTQKLTKIASYNKIVFSSCINSGRWLENSSPTVSKPKRK